MVRQAHHERILLLVLTLHRPGIFNKAIASQTRRSGESRNPGNPPGKERAGYRAFWIPAGAGTTAAWVALVYLTLIDFADNLVHNL